MSIQIDGMEELTNILGNIAVRDARNLNRATIHTIATEIKKESRLRAPRDTGTLRKGIVAVRRRPRNPDRPFSDVNVTGGHGAKHDAFYWRFVEYGTVKKSARPFIQPAIQDVRPRVVGIYRQNLGKKLEAMLKRKAKRAKR